MFRQEFIKERLKPVLLSASMADSGTIFSHIIPWNIHGALFAGTLGLATLSWAPYTFLAYLTPIVTFVMVYVHYMRKDQLASDEDAEKVYGDEPSQLPESTQLA
jgi:NhaC family Na+:H+ antiporter